jgi:hypothetical protein
MVFTGNMTAGPGACASVRVPRIQASKDFAARPGFEHQIPVAAKVKEA